MSRINPERGSNPAARFLEWKGGDATKDRPYGKCFAYWDREAEEEKPIRRLCFAALLKLSCIRGFNKALNCGIISNEVRDINNDVLHVRYQKGGVEIASGTYAQIKDHVTSKSVGGNYCVSLYVAAFRGKSPDDTELWNIQLTGSGRGWFFDFAKKHALYQERKAVRWDGEVERHETPTGDEYFTPIATMVDVPQEFEDQAGELQEQVLEYYRAYSQASSQARETAAAPMSPASYVPDSEEGRSEELVETAQQFLDRQQGRSEDAPDPDLEDDPEDKIPF